MKVKFQTVSIEMAFLHFERLARHRCNRPHKAIDPVVFATGGLPLVVRLVLAWLGHHCA
jgi:hypothetical protein